MSLPDTGRSPGDDGPLEFPMGEVEDISCSPYASFSCLYMLKLSHFTHPSSWAMLLFRNLRTRSRGVTTVRRQVGQRHPLLLVSGRSPPHKQPKTIKVFTVLFAGMGSRTRPWHPRTEIIPVTTVKMFCGRTPIPSRTVWSLATTKSASINIQHQTFNTNVLLLIRIEASFAARADDAFSRISPSSLALVFRGDRTSSFLQVLVRNNPVPRQRLGADQMIRV